MRTLYDGSVGASYQSLPWGDGYTATVNNSYAGLDSLDFAGLERDVQSTTNPEEDTEHAQFRNYAPAQGRWLSSDRYLGSYDFANPQSLNRYAYVLNNPTSFTDPSGLLNCKFGPCAPLAPGCDDGCPPASPPSPSSGDPGCWSCGGTPGGGGGGGGGQPGNQQIYTFSKTVYSTWLQNFDLQLWILTSVPFSSSSGQGVAPNRKYHCPLFGPCYQGPAINARQTQCTGQAIRNNALALGADSLGAIPGEGQVLAGVQLAAAGVGFVNGLVTKDATGAVGSVIGGQLTLVGASAEALGTTALMAVPVAGNLLSGFFALRDIGNGISDYQACLAGH